MFSKAFQDFVSRCGGDDGVEFEKDFKWFTGDYGMVRALRQKKLTAVPPDRVLSDGYHQDQASLQIMERKFQQALLSRFVDPFADDEVPNEFKPCLPAMRELCVRNGCTDSSVPIVRRIKAGGLYRMKLFASLCGPCYEDFNYLQGWEYDDTIIECGKRGAELLVFGGPWSLLGSESKKLGEQKELLAKVTKDLKLPFNLTHGSVALDALVIQSQELLTGEQHPLNNRWVRTATTLSSGLRLDLRRCDGRLHCGDWHWYDVEGHDNLGCLALGVKVLGR